MSVIVPTSLRSALQALDDAPQATVLAGGTDLMVELNSGHRQVAVVIAVNRIPELCSWSHDPSAGLLHIGAGITYDEIARDQIAQWVPALAQAARTVGSPQIRHAATIGEPGNLFAGWRRLAGAGRTRRHRPPRVDRGRAQRLVR